jgi:thiol-disulfide isomerase/thioredoxin
MRCWHNTMNTLKNIFAVAAVLIAIASASFAQTSLPSLDGGSVDVQAQKGKVVVLAVGATWLPLSAKQAQFTNAMVKNYGGKNVAFYFIATDSTDPKDKKNHAKDEKIREWATANKLTINVLRDSNGDAVTKNFEVDQLPAFIVLDKNGARSEIFTGIDPNYDITVPISKKIDSLL